MICGARLRSPLSRFFSSCLLLFLLTAAVCGAAELDWNEQLQNLKTSLLKNLSYTAKLAQLLNKQKLSLGTSEQLIADLRKSSESLKLRLSALELQLEISNDSTLNLQQELAKLSRIHAQLTVKHAEVWRSWTSFRETSTRLIDRLEKKGRAYKVIAIGGITYAVIQLIRWIFNLLKA